MRMWVGSLIRVTPSFVQVMVAVVEFAVQYSQITVSSTMLWTPLLLWKRMSGRGVTASWPLTTENGEGVGKRRRKGEGREEHYITPRNHMSHCHTTPSYSSLTIKVSKLFHA